MFRVSLVMARPIHMDHLSFDVSHESDILKRNYTFTWGPCAHFAQGLCRAGRNCKYSHETKSGLEDAVVIKLGDKIRLKPSFQIALDEFVSTIT